MPINSDIIILGLGGMGSAAAYHLASRGRRVLGLEKFSPLHSNGSSHGDSRIIRQAYHENPNYVPLSIRAYELWHRLEHDSGTKILHQTGGLMIGQPGSKVVEGALLSARQHNLPHRILNASEIRTRYPALNPRAGEIALYEEVAGYLNPEAAIHAHLNLAAKQGAELHFEEPVIEWSASDNGVKVKTSQATYEANRLVIAPGAWAPDILSDLQISFHIHRHVMCWFEPLAEVALPIYIWDVDGRDCFYGLPFTGTSQGIKAALHSGGHLCTAATVDREIHDSDITEVRQYLARFIPALNGPLRRAVTCLYTMTPDEHFVVALHPRHPQVSIAAGFSGHGFKFSSVMGEVLADLAISGQTNYPIGFLAPTRYI